MIFKLTFPDRTDYAQAKTELHLLQEYSQEYDDFLEIKEVEEIEPKAARSIMLTNTEYDADDPQDMPEEISLYDLVVGDDFCIVGSSEWE